MSDDREEANAFTQLLTYLWPGEVLEWIVLGDWMGSANSNITPEEKLHTLLDPGDAEPLMRGWRLLLPDQDPKGGHAVQAWTSLRILRTQVIPGTFGRLACIVALPRHPQSFRLYNEIDWIQPNSLVVLDALPTPQV